MRYVKFQSFLKTSVFSTLGATLTSNTNLFEQLNFNQIFGKIQIDPDDENRHLKQRHITIELRTLHFRILNCSSF